MDKCAPHPRVPLPAVWGTVHVAAWPLDKHPTPPHPHPSWFRDSPRTLCFLIFSARPLLLSIWFFPACPLVSKALMVNICAFGVFSCSDTVSWVLFPDVEVAEFLPLPASAPQLPHSCAPRTPSPEVVRM